MAPNVWSKNANLTILSIQHKVPNLLSKRPANLVTLSILLFSGGTSDGYVSLWDIGTPTLPSYEGVNPTRLLRCFPDYGDVYNIAWTGDNRWLLAGTAAGLVGWHMDDDKIVAGKEAGGKEFK